jgi:hypothetical protein
METEIRYRVRRSPTFFPILSFKIKNIARILDFILSFSMIPKTETYSNYFSKQL